MPGRNQGREIGAGDGAVTKLRGVWIVQTRSTPRIFVFPADTGDGYWGWSAPRRSALFGEKGLALGGTRKSPANDKG